MYPDQRQFFERSDKWHYRLLLQELYRNCVLSSHDGFAFIDHVRKLDIAITDFPGLDIRTMITERMLRFKKERHDKSIIRLLKFKTSHSTQPLANSMEFQTDMHDIEHVYHQHLFDVLRDTLASFGAFNLSKQEREHGYELQETI